MKGFDRLILDHNIAYFESVVQTKQC